jgi:hypothetical protein
VPDQFGLANEWHARLVEPVRARPRNHAALDQFNRNPTFYNYAQIQLFRSWFNPLSEPVRRKPPLPQGSMPYLFFLPNLVGFYFALTETSDSASLSFATYTPKHRGAYVSIIEIGQPTCHVSIVDLKDHRE